MLSPKILKISEFVAHEEELFRVALLVMIKKITNRDPSVNFDFIGSIYNIGKFVK
jgi:hypothetical protein